MKHQVSFLMLLSKPVECCHIRSYAELVKSEQLKTSLILLMCVFGGGGGGGEGRRIQ